MLLSAVPDAPSDSIYIVCGVVIAMALVAAIIILLAVFISKLRKREENGVRQDHVILHSAQQNNNHCHHNNNSSGAVTAPATANGGTTIPTVSATVIYPPPVPSPTDATLAASGNSTPRQFLWQVPPTHPGVLYNNDREMFVHRSLPLEEPGFCRGFRKSLQGRWKRLVKKKPINETYAIPPELRDQLKNIYVYWPAFSQQSYEGMKI